jgi:hypothetical protein
MYNPNTDGFFPCRINGKITQVPMREILLGRIDENPYHPDPALEAFLRYVPSLFLQVLDLSLDEDECLDLIQAGTESDSFPAYQAQVERNLKQKQDIFQLYPDRNGFFQHYDVREEKLPKTDLDALLIHSASGNNPIHHRAANSLQQICISCALITLIHHNNFCLAGTVGHSNVRGQTCYLCMIHEEDPFKRMILNTCFPSVMDEDDVERYGWSVPMGDDDQPSWIRIGRKGKKGFEENSNEVGLIRSVLFTPRHAFFDVEKDNGRCDLCGIESDRLVRRYFWRRYGNKIKSEDVIVRHPTQSVYHDKNRIFPHNYNPSIWKNLGSLIVKDFEIQDKRYDVAPIVQQFKEITLGDDPYFTLELMAYQANQAKLLDFHHEFITLPYLNEDLEVFYRAIEAFTTVVSRMLQTFRYYGTADKKRERIQVTSIEERHLELTERFGRETMNGLHEFRSAFLNKTLGAEMKNKLEEYKRRLRGEFEYACRNEFAWDDIAAQKKLNMQKRKLATSLKNIVAEFQT